MSDRDLQTLRRTAAATGAPSDRAALLRARVRAGELTLERVQLAAFCLDEAATRALDWPGDGEVWSARGWRSNYDRDLGAWVYDLGTWADVGRVSGWVLVLAQAAAARAVVAFYHDKGRPLGLEPLRALESAEDWLDDPTDATRGVAVVDWTHAWGPDWGARHANLWLPILPDWATGKWSDVLQPRHAIERAAEEAGEAPVRAAICSALTSWALEDA